MKSRKLTVLALLASLVLNTVLAAEPYEVVLAFSVAKMPLNLLEVQEEMNKITIPKINAKVKLLPLNFSAYMQQLNLVLAGNEKWDLIVNGSNFGLYNQVARKQLLPLDDLINKYGAGYKEVTAQVFRDCGKVNGQTYLTVNLRPMAASYGVAMRKDLCEKYKIDYKNMKTLDDVYAALKIIKEKEPDVVPITPQGIGQTMVQYCRSYDILGSLDGILPDFGQGLKVVNYYETAEYEKLCRIFRKWYQEGLIKSDVATTKDSFLTIRRAGKSFAYLSNLKPGYDTQETNANGYEMVTADIYQAIATTSDVTGFGWSIPRTCKDPVTVMKYLNLLYTDSKLSNLVINGIEGKHYQYVKGKKNTIEYPAGMPDKSDYFMGTVMGYMFPNQGITPVWIGNPENYWDLFRAFNMNALRSKAMGFAFDANPVKTEITAVTNVANQYKLSLENGTVDVDKILPEFRARLKAAGIEKIVAEKQKQLDAWAKANKVK